MLHRALPAAAVVAALTLAACHRDRASAPQYFSYSGRAATGHWVRLRNVTGPITVVPAAGDRLEIEAREMRGGGVRFAYDTSGGDVTVCALYGASGRCTGSDYHTSTPHVTVFRLFGSRHQTGGSAVTFTVSLPAGMRLDASTIDGPVAISAPATALRMKSVNGPLRADAATGPVDAVTVNGSIDVHVVGPLESLRLKSVNGPVTATLPGDVSGDVSLHTVNGRASSDFGLPSSSGGKRVEGTLGAGDRRIELETINGSVSLKRG